MGWLRHREPKRNQVSPPRQAKLEACTPVTHQFWQVLRIDQTTACRLVECYPEYWLHRPVSTYYTVTPAPGDWGAAKSRAQSALADALAETRSLRSLPPTHPFHWCLRGYDVDEATERALTASGFAVPEIWNYWLDLRPLRERFDRQPTAGEPEPWTLPEYWILAGNDEQRAALIVRCYPEYWLNQGVDWHSAKAHADDSRQTAASDEPIDNRDPLYWHQQGNHFDEATEAALAAAQLFLPRTWALAVQKRQLVESLGPQAAILPDGAIYVGGATLTNQTAIAKQSRSATRQPASAQTGSLRPRWGPLCLDAQTDARLSCCVVGSPAAAGSLDAGNTLVLRLFMQSVANARWLLFDGDANLFPVVRALRPKTSVHLFDPCDDRACGWEIARDADSPQRAEQVAAQLIPEDPRDPPTLVAIARDLASATINVLNEIAAGQWSLVHLLALLEPANIDIFLVEHPSARDLLRTHLDASLAQTAEIQSFLDSKLRPLRPLAAAMTHAQDRFSITDWLQSSHVMLLRDNQGPDTSSARTNRVLIELAVQALLDPSSPPTGATWVFFNGLEQLGRLGCLQALLRHGPARNIVTVLSLTDIETLQHHYGPDAAGLLGLCGNYAFLRTNNPLTARLASEVMGTQEVVLLQQSEAMLGSDKSQGFATARQVRPLVAPSELQQLPAPTRRNGLTGYFKHNSQPPYRGEITPQELFPRLLKPPAQNTPVLQPRPAEQFQFPPDTVDLLCQLGFPRPKPKTHTGWDAAPAQDSEEFDPDDFPRIIPG